MESEAILRELHSKGEKLLETYKEVRKHNDISYSEWRILTGKYIPKDIQEIFTNKEGNGVIDIAEIMGVNLNNNDKFKKFFWSKADIGLCQYLRSENEAVKRGWMGADGVVRVAEGDYGE